MRGTRAHADCCGTRLAATLLAVALCGAGVSFPASADHHEAKQTEAIPVAKRMEIFRELQSAEVRAERDADEKWADDESMARVEWLEKLSKEYRAKLLETHDITAQQAEEIVAEGYAESWPSGEAGAEVKTSLD